MAKFVSVKRFSPLFAGILFAVNLAHLAAVDDLSDRVLHFPLWAMLDAYPGTEEASRVSDNAFAEPVSKIRETAPFLVQGMIYGFTFSYTPSDMLRNVAEAFSFEPVRELGDVDKQRISYTQPRIEGSRLYCWVDFERTANMIFQKKQWESVKSLRVSGRGSGRLEDGFAGILDASRDALKNAVREYGRSIAKNKLKEITGTAIITGTPKIGINSGKYAVTLDFFLQIDIIVPYTQF
jgi:hypothetical protein